MGSHNNIREEYTNMIKMVTKKHFSIKTKRNNFGKKFLGIIFLFTIFVSSSLLIAQFDSNSDLKVDSRQPIATYLDNFSALNSGGKSGEELSDLIHLGYSTPNLVNLSGISITGNEELDQFCEDNGTDGLTFESAHIIEDLSFTTDSNSTAISLLKVDRYLIIRNVTFYGTLGPYTGFRGSIAMVMENCSNLFLQYNVLTEYNYGIVFVNSTEINISNNSFSECGNGIYMINSSQIEIEDNKIITYWGNHLNAAIIGDFTFDIQVANNKIYNYYTGIWINFFNNAIIENNTIMGSVIEGIHLSIWNPWMYSSVPKGVAHISNNIISDIIVQSDYIGSHQGIGIYISDVVTVDILNNIINNCSIGLVCWNIGNLTVFHNSILNIGQCGLILRNIEIGLYYFNLIGGKMQENVDLADLNEYVGNWDNGSVGNYWSDYVEKCPNAVSLKGGKIWDTPYSIGDGNYDNFPLVNPSWDLSSKSAPFFILGYPIWIILGSLGVLFLKPVRNHSNKKMRIK